MINDEFARFGDSGNPPPSVRDILNLRRPPAPPNSEPGIEDIHPAVFALMQGLTNMRSERAAQDAANETATAPVPEIATKTRVDPSTGQTVHDISYKNVQVGDAQAKAQEAYDGPQRELGATVDRYLQNTAKRYNLKMPGADGTLPTDLQTPALDSFGGKYRAEREAGHNPFSALVHAIGIQALPDSMERDREGLLGKFDDRQRKEAAIAYSKTELPVASELDKQRRLDNSETRTQDLESRFDQRTGRQIINRTNFADLPDADSRVNAVANEWGVAPDQMPSWALGAIAKKTTQDLETKRAATVKAARSDKKGLGQYPTLDAAQAAVGAPLKDNEKAGFEADYKSARAEKLRVDQNEQLKVNADQRGAEASVRGAAASERAAAAAERAAAKDHGQAVDSGALITGKMTPETLLSRRGNSRYDQDSVQAAINAGVEHYQRAIDDRNARITANNDLIAHPPEKVTEGYRSSLARARGDNRRMVAANRADRAALSKLGGADRPAQGTQPAGPTVVAPGTRGSVVKDKDGNLVYVQH